MSNQIKTRYPAVKLGFEKIIYRDDDLTVDYLYIPAEKKTEKIWVLTSGVHGIESYVGSALLNWVMETKLNKMKAPDIGVLLIHSLNPYGHFHQRRVNENNIDLNRSFILDFNSFTDPNTTYHHFNSLLNPKKPVEYNQLTKYLFWVRGAYNILRHGMGNLRKAIVGGQYSFAQGIFYGGDRKQQSVLIFEKITKKFLSPYQTVLHIDFHTGYGEWAKLHFYGRKTYPQQVEKDINHLFQGYKVDRGGDEDFYQVYGDITTYLESLFPDKRIIPMTFEYGTMNSQKISGSLESLFRIIKENQKHHHGVTLAQDEQMVKAHFMEMFNPSSEGWRQKVEAQTSEIFDQLTTKFSQL